VESKKVFAAPAVARRFAASLPIVTEEICLKPILAKEIDAEVSIWCQKPLPLLRYMCDDEFGISHP
jgi:hypothetical protein